MVNYQNSKIYAIRSYQTDDVYIGSTTQPLSKRIGEHRNDKKKYDVGKTNFVTSFKLLEHPDAYIELIELFPCNTKEELHKREGEIIRNTEHCVNKCIPGRTMQEWRIENKEKLQEQNKQYYKSKKGKIFNRNKCKKYYKENKQKISEISAQKIKCECGKEVRKMYIATHKKSEKHQKLMNKLQNGGKCLLALAKQKIMCVCGQEISKGSMSKHKRSLRHTTRMIEHNNLSGSDTSESESESESELESDKSTSSDEE
jgi:hypothetical protein